MEQENLEDSNKEEKKEEPVIRKNANKKEGSESSKDSPFECNICLDAPSEPVVTFCGHLFW